MRGGRECLTHIYTHANVDMATHTHSHMATHTCYSQTHALVVGDEQTDTQTKEST